MADIVSYYANKKQYYIIFHSVINGENPVQFPAMLTEFQDSFSPSWTPQKVFGRQDPILTFQNTERKISVGFSVPSNDKNQAKSNFQQLNRLINYLYPAFAKSGSANTISASPLFKIKFANLIYDKSTGRSAPDGGSAGDGGLVCAITDFNHTFDFDGKAGWVDEVGSAIPSLFTVSFSATVIHTHDLGYIEGIGYQSDALFPYYINSAAAEFGQDTVVVEQGARSVLAAPSTGQITGGD